MLDVRGQQQLLRMSQIRTEYTGWCCYYSLSTLSKLSVEFQSSRELPVFSFLSFSVANHFYQSPECSYRLE